MKGSIGHIQIDLTHNSSATIAEASAKAYRLEGVAARLLGTALANKLRALGGGFDDMVCTIGHLKIPVTLSVDKTVSDEAIADAWATQIVGFLAPLFQAGREKLAHLPTVELGVDTHNEHTATASSFYFGTRADWIAKKIKLLCRSANDQTLTDRFKDGSPDGETAAESLSAHVGLPSSSGRSPEKLPAQSTLSDTGEEIRPQSREGTEFQSSRFNNEGGSNAHASIFEGPVSQSAVSNTQGFLKSTSDLSQSKPVAELLIANRKKLDQIFNAMGSASAVRPLLTTLGREDKATLWRDIQADIPHVNGQTKVSSDARRLSQGKKPTLSNNRFNSAADKDPSQQSQKAFGTGSAGDLDAGDRGAGQEVSQPLSLAAIDLATGLMRLWTGRSQSSAKKMITDAAQKTAHLINKAIDWSDPEALSDVLFDNSLHLIEMIGLSVDNPPTTTKRVDKLLAEAAPDWVSHSRLSKRIMSLKTQTPITATTAKKTTRTVGIVVQNLTRRQRSLIKDISAALEDFLADQEVSQSHAIRPDQRNEPHTLHDYDTPQDLSTRDALGRQLQLTERSEPGLKVLHTDLIETKSEPPIREKEAFRSLCFDLFALLHAHTSKWQEATFVAPFIETLVSEFLADPHPDIAQSDGVEIVAALKELLTTYIRDNGAIFGGFGTALSLDPSTHSARVTNWTQSSNALPYIDDKMGVWLLLRTLNDVRLHSLLAGRANSRNQIKALVTHLIAFWTSHPVGALSKPLKLMAGLQSDDSIETPKLSFKETRNFIASLYRQFGVKSDRFDELNLTQDYEGEFARAIESLGTAIVYLWAHWLKGINMSSYGFLLEKVVLRPGSLIVDDDAYVIRLASAPYDPVLDLANYFDPIDRVSWHARKTVTFQRI